MKKIILGIAVLLLLMNIAYAAEYVQDQSSVLSVAFLNQDPDPARTGDTFRLRLRVENDGGGTIDNLQLEVLENYPFTVVNGNPIQNLGTLYAYQNDKNFVNVEYTLKVDKDAINGKHELKVRYREENGEWITASFSINVASKEFAQIVYVDKSKIEPGRETDMKFTITNIGSSALQNLVFSWSEPNGVVLPVFSDDTKYIKYLDVGQSAELKYTVMADVNANPGLYNLDLNLKYESVSNATTSTIKTKAGIFVGGETDFDVAFSQSSQGQTSLSVANTGNNPAQSVSVRVPEQENFRVSGSNSAIIGNLDKGDYTVVSFQIVQNTAGNFTQRQRQSSQSGAASGGQNAQRTAARNNNLLVTIDYTDTTGERRSVEKNVSIQFRPDAATGTNAAGRAGTAQAGFFSGWKLYAVLIIAATIGFYFRKRLALVFSKQKKN